MDTATTDLLTALRFLAARCDGAHARDGQGFNGTDAAFGKSLASQNTLSAKQYAAGRKLIRKYSGQLSLAGINPADLPEPAADATPTLSVRVFGPVLEVTGKGTFAAKDALKSCGAAWSGARKAWDIPLDRAADLAKVLSGKAVSIADNARPLLSGTTTVEVSTTASGTPAAPTSNRSIVSAGDGLVVFSNSYDARLVEAFRNLSGRRYMGGDLNSAPLNSVTLAFAVEHSFSGTEAIVTALDARDASAKAADAAADSNRQSSAAADGQALDEVAVGLEPYPYQWAGVRHILANRRVLVGDEMGVGKTATALVSLAAANAYPAVVVVPEVVRGNWLREAARFTPEATVEIATGTAPYETTADIVIIGYTALRSNGAAWATKLIERGIRAVVADEAHNCKSPKAAQTAAVKRLADAALAKLNWS